MRSINLNPFGGHSGAALEIFLFKGFLYTEVGFYGSKIGFLILALKARGKKKKKKKTVINNIEIPHSFWLFLRGSMRQSNGFIEKYKG